MAVLDRTKEPVPAEPLSSDVMISTGSFYHGERETLPVSLGGRHGLHPKTGLTSTGGSFAELHHG